MLGVFGFINPAQAQGALKPGERIIFSFCSDGNPVFVEHLTNSDTCALPDIAGPDPTVDSWGALQTFCGEQLGQLKFIVDADTDMNFDFSVFIIPLDCQSNTGATGEYSYSQTLTLPVASPVGSPIQVESADEIPAGVELVTMPVSDDLELTCGGLMVKMHLELRAPKDMGLKATASIHVLDCASQDSFSYENGLVELFGTPTPSS